MWRREQIQFGNVKVGQSTTQPVMLMNNGNVDLVLNSAQISGAGFAMSGLTFPTTIAAAKNVSFSVKFAPSAAQGMTGNIKFVDNAPNSTQSVEFDGNWYWRECSARSDAGYRFIWKRDGGKQRKPNGDADELRSERDCDFARSRIGNGLQHQRTESNDAECGPDHNVYGQVCANRNGKRDGLRDHYEQCIESDFDGGAELAWGRSHISARTQRQ